MKLKANELVFWERAYLAFLSSGEITTKSNNYSRAAAGVADESVDRRRARMEEMEPISKDPYRGPCGGRE